MKVLSKEEAPLTAFDGNELIMGPYTGSFTLNPSVTPKTIDVELGYHDRTIHGTYDLGRDTLTLGFTTDFLETAPQGKGISEQRHELYILKHDKDVTAIPESVRAFSAALQDIRKERMSEAIEKLHTCISDPVSGKNETAQRLLSEIELLTSETAAFNTLLRFEEADFRRFQTERHYSDPRITHPSLARMWNSKLLSLLPTAIKQWEEAHTAVEKVTPGILLKAYANTLAGDQRYKGKVLEVTGFVVYQHADHLNLAEAVKIPSPLDLYNDWDVVRCSSESGQLNHADLDREKVTIRGRCRGGDGKAVEIEDCSVVRNFRDDRLAKEQQLRPTYEQQVLTGEATAVAAKELNSLCLPQEHVYGSIAEPYDYAPRKVFEVTGSVESVEMTSVNLGNWWHKGPKRESN